MLVQNWYKIELTWPQTRSYARAMTNSNGTQQITSVEFTNEDNFNAVYNTFRGDFLEAHGIDRNKKNMSVHPRAFALQAKLGDKWVTTTRDSKDEMRYQATGDKTYRLVAYVTRVS